jgi:hypothetical protein
VIRPAQAPLGPNEISTMPTRVFASIMLRHRLSRAIRPMTLLRHGSRPSGRRSPSAPLRSRPSCCARPAIRRPSILWSTCLKGSPGLRTIRWSCFRPPIYFKAEPIGLASLDTTTHRGSDQPAQDAQTRHVRSRQPRSPASTPHPAQQSPPSLSKSLQRGRIRRCRPLTELPIQVTRPRQTTVEITQVGHLLPPRLQFDTFDRRRAFRDCTCVGVLRSVRHKTDLDSSSRFMRHIPSENNPILLGERL